MDLRREYTFDAPPAEVFAMFSDQAYVERRLSATGSLRSEVQLRPEDGGIRIETHRALPPRVPDAVRRFVGDTVELDEVQQWGSAGSDGSRTGTIAVSISGAPVRLTATTELHPVETGTRYTVTGTIKSSVPLLGRKIEDAAAPAVTAALDKEAQVGREWLAGQR